jgi:hypothetical protein
MEKRTCVPIISTNPTYLGLDMPAIAVNLLVMAAVLYWGSFFTKSWAYLYVAVPVQIFLDVIYVKIVLKLEENLAAVWGINIKIPNVVLGCCRVLPERPPEKQPAEIQSVEREAKA